MFDRKERNIVFIDTEPQKQPKTAIYFQPQLISEPLSNILGKIITKTTTFIYAKMFESNVNNRKHFDNLKIIS